MPSLVTLINVTTLVKAVTAGDVDGKLQLFQLKEAWNVWMS